MPIAARASADRAKTVIKSVLNCARDVDRETIWLIERMSATGSPVALRSASCALAAAAKGADLVLIAHAVVEMRLFNALTRSGICPCGTNIFGLGSWLSP